MIPCKEDKCILFPACKSKDIIYCKPLLQYIKTQRSMNPTMIVWGLINDELPKVLRVYHDEVQYASLGKGECQSTMGIPTYMSHRDKEVKKGT